MMNDYAQFKSLLVEKRDGVATVTLNRPERLNAVDSVMHYELTKIWRLLLEDKEVRAAVLTGAGRAFCSGGDFGPGYTMERITGLTNLQEARLIVDEILDFEKPVICGLNGHAMGIGASIALSCDVVYMSKTGRIADPHVRMGLTAGDGGAVFWPLLMGPARAKYWLMTGDHCTAEQALELGLIHEVVEDADAARAAATALAQRLAKGAPYAIASTKVAVNKYIRLFSDLILTHSLTMEAIALESADHKEAVQAFQEKREPQFR